MSRGPAPSSPSSGDGDYEAVIGDECEPGTSEACDCPSADGTSWQSTRACVGGYWYSCNCFDESSFDISGDCKPGRYEGDFWGFYTSSFTFVGVPIPVFSLSATNEPGLAFTLHSNGTGPVLGQEFAEELEIRDGYVKGTADGLFPFEGKLTGKLDCKTKKFEAILDGGYCLIGCAGIGVNQADFEGPVVGYYDAATCSFAKSTWTLVEETPLQGPIFGFGGEGEWSAKWVGPAAPSASP